MRRVAISVASLALVVAPAAAVPATAADPLAARPDRIAAGLTSPLSLSITAGGGAWYSQNFAGLLMRSRPGKRPEVMFRARKKGTEVGAVSYMNGTVTFATTAGPNTSLMRRGRNGKVRKLASLSAFERNRNPDGSATYGFRDVDDACAEQLPEGFAPYPGIVESHPYATLRSGPATYVADAAGNTILKVARGGKVRTVAVLPAQPTTVDAATAEAFGLPDCVVGEQFYFEPVPTDVEQGRSGMLYVSTLPGGPEDASLGRRAAVHRVNPRTGQVTTMARGLLSATGIAVAANGDVYIAELFRNRISRIPRGSDTPTFHRKVNMPGDVEMRRGHLWATKNVLTGMSGQPGDRPRGQVIRY